MKESIEYNYNILIDNYESTSNVFSFMYNNDPYVFSQYKRNQKDIIDIQNISNELKTKNIQTFELIKNKKNEIITKISEENYVLIRLSNNYKEQIDIIDMIEYNKKTSISKNQIKNYVNNWDELWSEKVDYYEYQISELGESKSIIVDSFSYFIGLSENAIALCTKVNKLNSKGKDEKLNLNHRRVKYPNYLLNYANPISYLIDIEVRDIAEYIKSVFFADDNALLELVTYLKSVKLSNYLYQMLYVRLLFPTYYFDLYEEGILGSVDEKAILKIVNKIDDFEYFLKEAYDEISKYSPIEAIRWLN